MSINKMALFEIHAFTHNKISTLGGLSVHSHDNHFYSDSHIRHIGQDEHIDFSLWIKIKIC